MNVVSLSWRRGLGLAENVQDKLISKACPSPQQKIGAILKDIDQFRAESLNSRQGYLSGWWQVAMARDLFPRGRGCVSRVIVKQVGSFSDGKFCQLRGNEVRPFQVVF